MYKMMKTFVCRGCVNPVTGTGCTSHYIFHLLQMFSYIKVFPLSFRCLMFDHALVFFTGLFLLVLPYTHSWFNANLELEDRFCYLGDTLMQLWRPEFELDGINSGTHTHTAVLRLCGICQGQPGCRYQKKHSPTHTHRGHQSSQSAFSIY